MFTLPHGVGAHGSIVRQAFAEGLLPWGGDADGMTLVHAVQFVQLLLSFGVGYSDIATGTDALESSVRVLAEVVGALGRGVIPLLRLRMAFGSYKVMAQCRRVSLAAILTNAWTLITRSAAPPSARRGMRVEQESGRRGCRRTRG